MHRSEESGLSTCADCGAEFAASTAAGFGFGTRSALCFDCAIRRGGRYDEPQDHWTVEPRLDGLDFEDE